MSCGAQGDGRLRHSDGAEQQDSAQDGEHDPGTRRGRGQLLARLFRRGFVAPVLVQLVHQRALGVLLDVVGVPEGEEDADDRQQQPAEEAVADAGEGGQSRQSLGDADGEGVEHGAREADVGRHVAHEHARDGVVAHGDGQRHEDADEGDGLLAHAKDRPEEAEHQHDADDEDVVHPDRSEELVFLYLLCLLQEEEDALVDSVGLIHDPEGAADHQDEDDDVGGALEALEEGSEDLPRLGLALHAVVGVVHHDVALVAVHVNRLPVELATRDDPGEGRADHDDGKYDGEGVRYVQFLAHGREDLLLELLEILDFVTADTPVLDIGGIVGLVNL